MNVRHCRLLLSLLLTIAICPACTSAVPAPDHVARVIIIRDSYGIPHIRGKTDADVAFGLAYAHAEDDFPIIQESLAASRGRLGELTGPQGAVSDYIVHLLKVRTFVDEKYESDLSPQFRAVCEAYAAGLSYYAQLHPSEADPTFLPYTGKDVVAGFVHKTPFFFGLDKTLKRLQRPPGDTPRKDRRAADADDDAFAVASIGSNTFAVGPTRSADGKTRLNINSHQPWEGPVTWYEAHVKSDEGWDMIGGLFPGTPMVLHGHNRYLGWAHTVNHPDLANVYRLEINPDNPNQYKLDGQWKNLEVGWASFSTKLIGSLKLPIRRQTFYSVHGPVMKFEHGVYAIRFAGWGDIRAAEQWYRMNKARNFDEWIAAMKMRAIPCFNVCYADKDGTIYYLYNALFPKRDESQNWKGILPGNTSGLIWNEYLSFESLPQVKNPASGFVQNANSTPYSTTVGPDNPKPADFSPTCGIETNLTDRARRILELLDADTSITHEEFLRYKWDQTVPLGGLFWSRIKPLLEQAPPPDDDLAAAAAILKHWNRIASADNTDASLAILVNYQYEKASYLGYPAPEPWDALRAAVAHLKKHFGRLDVPLGELQRVRRGKVDLPVGGAPHAYNTTHAKEDEKDGRLVGLNGDSYVLIAAFDKTGLASSQAIHQYGNVNRPNSPHYADQAPLFVRRELRTSWLSDADLLSNLEHAYHPGAEAPSFQSK